MHTPDLYEGRTFAELADGMAYVQETGFETILERGRLAAEGLPVEIVYAGLSLGAMPAQFLAQTRPGAKGALLLHAAIPLSEFGGAWPEGVPLQIHTMEDDELGDVDVARELADDDRGRGALPLPRRPAPLHGRAACPPTTRAPPRSSGSAR